MADDGDVFDRAVALVRRAQAASLGDATVTAEDTALLSPPHWLNDALLSLWVEFVKRTAQPVDGRVVIIPPNMAYFLMLCNDEADAAAACEALALGERDLVVLLVNDGVMQVDSTTAGSHWSVLAYVRAEDTFFAYDSLGMGNKAATFKLAAAIAAPIGTDRSQHVVFADVGQQVNSYDCGAHACVVVRRLVADFRNGRKLTRNDCAITSSAASATALREEMAKLIMQLASDASTEGSHEPEG